MLLQALYQWQITGDGFDELRAQFAGRPGYDGIDDDFFAAQLKQIMEEAPRLDAHIGSAADRPVEQLDLVEHAVLWIGLAELRHRTDVPPAVAINEAVKLAKEFGASESHRFINAILDGAVPAD